MSYPPPIYHGTLGEATARVVPGGGEPQVRYPSGNTVEYLATTGETDGQFGLFRWTFGTAVTGPGAHFHRTMSESFFVLSGRLRLFDGNGWIDAAPGDFMHVPPGGLHGFRNESGEPAQMLLLFTPGAPREAYFETLAEGARLAAMTDAERADFYLRHDNNSV